MSELAPRIDVSSPTRAAALALAACGLAGCAQIRELRNRIVCVDAPAPPAYDLVQRVGTFASRYARDRVGYVLAYPDRIDPRTVNRVAYLIPDRDAISTMAPLGFAGALRAHAHASGPFALLAVDAPSHPIEMLPDLQALVTTLLRHPAREALIGFSSGGSGALLTGEADPGRYAAVAVAGPELSDDGTVNGAVRLSGHSVLIRIGESDPFVGAARTFSARCPTATLEVVRGCHDDGFWRASADALVGFAATGLFA